jgi:hypothetical protein
MARGLASLNLLRTNTNGVEVDALYVKELFARP